jgi:thiamine transport system ATP-binding protein
MLEVHNATVIFNSTPVLDGVSVAAPLGSVTGLLGPSGSGKSTLLRLIAGLQEGGEVIWKGRSMDSVPPHRRPFGLMFQDHALFPHLDVGRNVAFGLEVTHAPDIPSRVARVLDMVGLTGFERRDPATLSGGEAQRVALARALAPEPELLMLDEPLGSLDRALRDRLIDDLAQLFADLDLTVIYVTHDHDEARTLADHVVLLDAGRVVQTGPADEVFTAPVSEAAAGFLGLDPAVIVHSSGEELATPWGTQPTDMAAGDHRVVIPPAAVRIAPDGPLSGLVQGRRFVGGRAMLRIAADGGTVSGVASAPPARGSTVRFVLDADLLLRYAPAEESDTHDPTSL